MSNKMQGDLQKRKKLVTKNENNRKFTRYVYDSDAEFLKILDEAADRRGIAACPQIHQLAFFYARTGNIRFAAQLAGYAESCWGKHIYNVIKRDKFKEYYRQECELFAREGALDVRWFIAKCMDVLDTCSQKYRDKIGQHRCVDAQGAARMANVLKEALPDFVQRVEVQGKQVFKIGDQTIEF